MSIRNLTDELYEKHKNAFTSGQKNYTSIVQDQQWSLSINSVKKRRTLKISVLIGPHNVAKNYPKFSISTGTILLPGGSAGSHKVLSMRGRISDMYDKYCEFNELDYILEFKRSRLGWKDGKITYTASVKLSEPNQLSQILNSLANLNSHIEKLMLTQ